MHFPDMASEWDECDTGSDFKSNRFGNNNDNSNDGADSSFRPARGGGNRGFGGRNNSDGFQRRSRDNDENSSNAANENGGSFNRGRNDRGGDRGRGGGGGGGFGRRENDNGEKSATEFKDDKPKEFYIPPDPSNDENEIFSTGITSGINFAKYDKIPVNVTGDNAPNPILRFREAGLSEFLCTNIEKSGYKEPTPIQKTAIPIILAKRDLMACAQTGSGKTAAFIIPILHTLLTENKDMTIGKPQVVIISPTRELTSQIYNEVHKFGHGSVLKFAIAYGGTASRHQSANIARGCHVLVATPGRLLDFVNKGYITFDDIRFIVLDEADRMLDMGFMGDIEKVMNHPTMVPMHERQTLMFSATFPEEIQVAAGKFLNNYIFVTIGIVGGACSDVEQIIYDIKKFEKRDKLMEILDAADPTGTIVFVETKRDADFLASFLSETTHPTTSIHGDREQKQREEALSHFKSGRMKILIATSVAARGLDIKNVAHVINYNLPKHIEDYVHRIGRTGRVGNRGKATSFFDQEEDAALAGDLKKILMQAEQLVPEFLVNCSGGSYSGRSNFGGKDVRRNHSTPAVQEESEEW